ncbi:hypothetical protein KHC28_10370 [Ancylobacter sonchi]|uniref:hypothetical protein n=1 Tax=Ancylobacter sonchi TaxID=1937790 RepID=UPI001BD4B150|nr:hypothetical protein [Ancylobacter sonchi]MBS7534061.1 hypothetical protein [Ancylobacter sonchi]
MLNLFVRHGAETYADALETLQAYYAAHLPNVARTLVVIDNARPEGSVETLPGGAALLGASNALWEFSAWDAGLDALHGSLMQYDYVHFVTSAYRQLYTAYIDRIDTQVLSALRGRDVVIGHIDAYPQPVGFLGRTSQAWLRSCFLFMPPATLRRLGPITSLRDPARWFSGNPDAPFRDDAPLSADFRAHIVNWLTGEGTGQGTAWHSRFALDAGTLAHFEAKALAILNEHALSMRLYGQGTALVDATWIAAALQRKKPLSQDHIGNWRAQLAERQPYL